MNFIDLARNNITNRGTPSNFSRSYWPSTLTIDTNLKKNLENITNLTNKQYLIGNKSSGRVGWEYGLNVYYLVDSLYLGNPLSGTWSSVSISEAVDIKTKYVDNNENVYYELTLGDKAIKSKKYAIRDLGKQILFGRVCGFHTHPKYVHNSSASQFTFFSAQDISIVMYGREEMLGLTMGRSLWIACRTAEARVIPHQKLYQASVIELQGNENDLRSYVANEMSEYGIIFYSGAFGSTLKKL